MRTWMDDDDDDDCCGGRCWGIPPPRGMLPLARSRCCGGASRRAFTSASVVLISLRFTVVPPKNFKKERVRRSDKYTRALNSGADPAVKSRLRSQRRDAALNPSGNIARECATCYTSQGENAKLNRSAGILANASEASRCYSLTITAD